jgi:geranylgeranyl reductase
MARLAADAGAEIRTQALFRSVDFSGGRAVVEYADLDSGRRRTVRGRHVFFASGATSRFESPVFGRLAMQRWSDGLMTTLQHRVYLTRPALPIAYQTLEMHYYTGSDGRQIIGWMFPKRDHLAIGLGVLGKVGGARLRVELESLVRRICLRLRADVREIKQEGSLLYGGTPRSEFGDGSLLVGGTAAGLVDATNGEGIFEAAMSGRIAADCVVRERSGGELAATRFARLLRRRFSRRLKHRVTLMRYLEQRPRRFRLLFEQLARTPRLAAVLQTEDHERTMTDRLYLYTQALQFGMRTFYCRE